MALTWALDYGRTPPLEEIRQRLVDDLRRDSIREKTNRAIGELIDSYDLRITYDSEAAETDDTTVQ